jgi:phage head maturation protease
MNVVTKSVDAAVNPVESEHPNGEFEVVLSTEALDRDDENLWAEEWKQPLPARIHIDGDHGRTLEKTVGSAIPRLDGNRLVGKGTYAGTEYAQMVRQLVNEGHINSVSVTYAERKFQKNGDTPNSPSGVQRELLNAAFVAIPANPEAVVLASKSAKVDVTAKFKAAIEAVLKDAGFAASGNNPEIKHDAMVQAIHDAAYQLGSQCFNEIAADPGVDEGANKGIDGYVTNIDTGAGTATVVLTKSSSPKAGPPQESTEEPTAPTADKAADAAEESADDAGTKAKNAAIAARARAYLISRKPNQES